MAVLCPRCVNSNPQEARFCMHCGAPLGTSAPPGYTPEHLRERVLTTRSAVEGERKHVTVLFLDIKDSVALSSRLGPDRWHEVLERFFRVLTAQVHGHEGTINQYTGDGIMALWGAPIADEHHADRACRAALAIRDALGGLAPELRASFGIELPVRIGINSGDVVVGKIGDDLRSDYTAQGQTVGLAARMEASCEPGCIVLTEHTARLLPPGFELSPLGEMAVKGTAPVSAFVLESVSDGRPSATLRERRAPAVLLGRSPEIARVEAALARAREGRGRVIGISGEAGIGKTRLCSELLARCTAQGVPTHATRCAPHERHRPLSSLLPLLRSFFGVRAADPPERARDAVREKLGPRLYDSLPIVCAGLEIELPSNEQRTMDPEARRRRLYGTLAEALAEAPAAALFVDDTHWIDPASDGLLAALVPAIARSRLLLVLNFRPEYSAPWMQADHYSSVRLSPLGKEDVEELIAYLAGRDASLAPLAAMLHERARGNPLFVEEMLRSLAESAALAGAPGAYRLLRPLEELSVPATVQSILAARIDRLGDGPKQLLQTAATIGPEFTVELLSGVLEVPEPVVCDAVQALERAGFVHGTMDDLNGRYAFRHPLVREVAYGSLIVQRRRLLHARIAELLRRDRQRSRTSEAAVIAQHFEAADDLARAAKYYLRAAAHAGNAHVDQAYAYWEKVATVAAQRPALAESTGYQLMACMMMMDLGWRRGMDRDTADRLYARACELMDKADATDRMRSQLHAAYGRVLSALAASDAYLEHAQAALRFARRSKEAGLIGLMASVYGQALCRSGQLEAGVRSFDDVLSSVTREPVERGRGQEFDVATWTLLLRGHALSLLGRFDEAQRDLESCLAAATDIDLLVAPRLHLVELGYYRGELAGMEQLAREAVEIAEKLGNSLARVNGHIAAGVSAIANGCAELAEQALRTAIELSASSRAGLEFTPRMYRHLADALRMQGLVPEAVRAASEAVECARSLKNGVAEAQALVAFAQARVSEGGRDALADAARVLERAAELAATACVRVVPPEIELVRAAIAARTGDAAAQLLALERAEQLLASLHAPARASAVRRMREEAAAGAR